MKIKANTNKRITTKINQYCPHVTMADEALSDVEISCKGIDMMVNNDWDGCEKLFAQYK